MKKEEIIKKLETASEFAIMISIDKVIELIKQLESETKTTLTPQFANELSTRIERTLDFNSDNLVDKDSAEFELFVNEVSLSRVNVDLESIMEHVNAIIDEYVERIDDREDLQVEAYNENSVGE
jgi:pyruvate-formate lyase-activating enzyme